MSVRTRAENPKDAPPTYTLGNITDVIVILTLFAGTKMAGVVSVGVLPEPAGLVYVFIIGVGPNPEKYSLAYK
jgi:hypothetical protein